MSFFCSGFARSSTSTRCRRRRHAALIEACRSRWLLDFHELLFDSADRHRRLNVGRLNAEFTRTEHREIMEAAVGRDVLLTVRLLNESMDTLVALDAPSTATDPPGTGALSSA